MITQIKKEWIAARKVKETVKANLLSTLVGEIEMVAKNDGQRQVTDADCLAKVKAFLKGVDAMLEVSPSDQKTLQEKAILEGFMPIQMSQRELEVTIQTIASEIGATSVKDMGKVMGALKAQYDGMYDGKTASMLVKECLK